MVESIPRLGEQGAGGRIGPAIMLDPSPMFWTAQNSLGLLGCVCLFATSGGITDLNRQIGAASG